MISLYCKQFKHKYYIKLTLIRACVDFSVSKNSLLEWTLKIQPSPGIKPGTFSPTRGILNALIISLKKEQNPMSSVFAVLWYMPGAKCMYIHSLTTGCSPWNNFPWAQSSLRINSVVSKILSVQFVRLILQWDTSRTIPVRSSSNWSFA